MVEVSLDLQEDKISTRRGKDRNQVSRSDRPAYENTDDTHKYPRTAHAVTFLSEKKRKEKTYRRSRKTTNLINLKGC